jgi:hypothetical protein
LSFSRTTDGDNLQWLVRARSIFMSHGVSFA